jgi:hydrogenase maturation protein HypF
MNSFECVYDICGTVQGVGFRPSVYRLARAAQLGGWVQNRSGSVRLCLKGPADSLDHFVDVLPSVIPAAASIQDIREVSRIPWNGAAAMASFSIAGSEADTNRSIAIPADLAMCEDCRDEVFDPTNRRFRYPFTTCTNCGPRLTVVEAVPYDRERTTLSQFPLCPRCQAEYDDPNNRRFHAESIACPECGPELRVELSNGSTLNDVDAIAVTRRGLATGHVVAIRGLGGYLLACDALQPQAIRCLRDKKARPAKPLAVMARSLEVARRYVDVDDVAERLLTGPEGAIVLLPPKPNIRTALCSDLISPDTDRVGVMLPTTPLHALLFESTRTEDRVPPFDLLVMTSGNKRGEPIATSNDDARAQLADIADLLLIHNRAIAIRNDDSVVAIQDGQPQVWRRSRGYAPLPMRTVTPFNETILALGADMKNTVALGFQKEVVLSPHLGDLEEPRALDSFERTLEYLPKYFDVIPDVVALDLHPDMQSSRIGRAYAAARGLPVVEIQHHEAHATACLAEHGHREGLVLVFDGTGLGPDGTLWGAELLLCNGGAVRRLASFAPVALPGGEAAIRHPARQLIARWHAAGARPSREWLSALSIREQQIDVWRRQSDSGLFTVMTHAAGRLFDSVAVLLGAAPLTISYEGQAAIRLERMAIRGLSGWASRFPFTSHEDDGQLRIDWAPSFSGIPAPIRDRGLAANLAMGFHEAVVNAALHMVEFGLGKTSVRRIGLSGGVFMNRILNEQLGLRLRGMGLELLRHKVIPPNDGGIAFGQAVLASYRREP